MIKEAEQLLSIVDEPENFLQRQQELLYKNPPQIVGGEVDDRGLPVHTRDFYEGKPIDSKVETNLPSSRRPRVLNIASGSDEARQLSHAINLDLSPTGRPDVIADGRYLPFANGSITVTMASHVLEHFKPEEITDVLKEWLRVTHPQGLLRIAVPDAEITLQEIVDGVTRKGEKAYDLEHGSAPLTQIYGLGGERKETDDRWRHHILFSEALLSWFLQQAGCEYIERYDAENALSFLSGIKTDETNSYSLMMEARSNIIPQQETSLLTNVIPVHNEEDRLPQFFWSLLSTIKKAPLKDFEVIFALNSCSDSSEELVQYFADQADFSVKVIKTKKGILPAFMGGINARELDGYICKIDVDTSPHPQALGLMYMYLSDNKHVQVTYAYPRPKEDEVNPYNVGEKFQHFRTQRNYFHGRTSMYKENPFNLFDPNLVKNSGVVVEDMVLSSCCAYYFGLDSISPTSHAIVYSPTPKTLDDLVHQRSRVRRENKRILAQFPQFRILKHVLSRKTLLPTPDDKSQEAELQRYYHFLTQATSHLARVITPTGIDDNHEWRSDEVEKLPLK
jgi:predicted SAM-dependent methyltransferase/glycosyltransferase involved in cell wall biosynthesis